MGRIIARLVDADTRAPVTEAFVELASMERRALTDSTGTVAFLDVPPGAHRLVIQHIRYGRREVPVDLEGLQSAILAIPLQPEAVAVDPIDVQIEHRPRYLEEEGFYLRRAHGVGHFFDPRFVDRWNVGAWARADLFVRLLKDMTPRFHAVPGLCGEPQVFIDGQPAFDDDGRLGGRVSRELEMMSTYMIGAVEVYTDVAGAPDFAMTPEAACGVIAVWTNRWRGRTREFGGAEIELCEPKVEGSAVVEGTIRDEFTGVILPGAHVRAVTHPAGRTRAAETREIIADRHGRYRVCDLGPDHALSLQVSVADRTGPELQVPIDGATVIRDLELRVAGPGDVVGRVIDRETGDPVASARVHVVDQGSRTQTDGEGYFRLDDVMPGDHVVEIAHLGFESVNEVISVVADRTLDLRVEMSADPIALEPLVVTALRDRRLELRGFYERRSWGERSGLGTFLDAEAIERRAPALTSSLLREVPGISVRCSGGQRGCLVGATRGAADCPRLNVFINGSLAIGVNRRDPPSVDELVRPGELAAVEVYPGAASAPAEYTGSDGRCGAVVIWTR